MLDPLPFESANRLVNVWLLRASRDNWHFHVPPADAAALRAATQVFDRVELYDSDRRRFSRGESGRSVNVASVSADFFELLGVRPEAGRLFRPGDEADRDGDLVVLSEALWRRDFGASPDVPGTILRLDDAPYRVVGVAPRAAAFPADSELWTLRRTADLSNGYVLARLAAGASPELAQRAMPSVVAAITNGRPNPGMSFRIESLPAGVSRYARLPWLLLLAAAGCVALIAFLNVANLLLSRAVGRRRDVAVRLALGATRGHITALIATEAAMLTAAAGSVSILVAHWTLAALRIWTPEDTPRRGDFQMDGAATATAIGLSLLCWLVLTVVPALALRRAGRDAGLGTAGTGAFGNRRDARVKEVLVVAEIALAFVLVAGASLFGTSMLRLTGVDPGFQAGHLTVVRLDLPADATQRAQSAQTIEQIEQNLRLSRDISAVATSTGGIMTGLGLIDAQRTLAQRITRDSGPAATAPEEAHFRRVTPPFFRTLGIAILDGRDFSSADRWGTRPVAIVNQAMARSFWGTTAVVGRRVSFERRDGAPVWLEIVGVAADTRDLALTTAPQPAFFAPLAQGSGTGSDGLTIFVRTPVDSAPPQAKEIRHIVHAVAPAWPDPDMSTMDQAIDRFVAAPRFRAGLVTGLAAIGLLLAALGIYAVVSHITTARAPEMAVRLALGASPARIAQLVIGPGLRLAGLGMIIGGVVAFSARKLVASVLFGVDATDPRILAIAPTVIVAAVLIATYLPARHAALTDPSRVMRGDSG